MNLKRKAFVTLIELMIAMALAMGLLTFVLYFYRYGVVMESELKKEEVRVFKERIFSGRLTNIFSRLNGEPFFVIQEQQGISIGPSLVFSFDSEGLSPTFHGPVIARLLIDPDKRLILGVWQNNRLLAENAPSPLHLEVLAENEEKISFQFLMGINTDNQSFPEWRPGYYLSTWKEDFKTLPSAIKISLSSKEFAFPIAFCPSASPIEKSSTKKKADVPPPQGDAQNPSSETLPPRSGGQRARRDPAAEPPR